MTKKCWVAGLAVTLVLPMTPFALGKAKKIQREDLAAYIQRMEPQGAGLPSGSPGSLWTDNGRLAFLTGDFKAGRVGDLITIVVVHDTAATNANSVATARTFAASSGITALAGQLKTGGVQQLFSPTSSQALTGTSTAATTSSLQTTLSGRVMAVLSSGLLVVEAERELTMNNENQTVLVRGLVRIGDIGPDNTVASNAIGNLELELKGKGVLSDGTRPPNVVVRTLLRILGF
jgi:flagellar L-ring protein precursor FlgH